MARECSFHTVCRSFGSSGSFAFEGPKKVDFNGPS